MSKKTNLKIQDLTESIVNLLSDELGEDVASEFADSVESLIEDVVHFWAEDLYQESDDKNDEDDFLEFMGDMDNFLDED